MATQSATHTVTRTPEHPGYDTLGDANNWGEDFYLLVDGQRIGGTYWASAERVKDGERWVSYGPAGYSFKHRTREDAEQAQLKALGLAGATVITEAGPAPQPEPEPLPVTWEQALAEAKDKGVGRCSNHAAMAAFCDANIQLLCGAVAPQLVWEGAMRKGMTLLELGRLAGKDPMAVEALMWV